MKTPTPDRIGIGLCLVAGGLDLGTGLSLVAVPQWILPLMGVDVPGSDGLVYLRFVGAFVAAVGASYLWVLAAPRERLRTVLGVTILFRLAAGGYSLAAIALGTLPIAWISVPVTDLGLVALQSWLLAKGAGRHV